MDPTIKREIEPLWVGRVYEVKIFIESKQKPQEFQYNVGKMGQMG